MNRHFSKEEIQTASGPVRRISPSPKLRKMQVRNPMRCYHMLPEWLPSTAQRTTGAGRMWGKGTLMHCWWKSNLLQPLCETVWKVLKALNAELSWDPATTLLGVYPKHMKTVTQKHTCTPMLLAALFTRSQYGSNPGVCG